MLPLLLLCIITTKITSIYSHTDEPDHELKWEYLNTTIPKGISDMSATSDGSNIYIFGGCDSGNTRADFDPNMFLCTSVSNAGFLFNPNDNIFVNTTDMPRRRYRHAAALANGKVYLVGGRDVMDSIITEVDVYDIASDTWSTPFEIESEMAKSDLGMFSFENSLYMVGGYDTNYTASDSTYKFDLDTLAVKKLGNMVEARGDIHAELVGNVAIVTGGFTHENEFCNAMNTTEQYNIATDTWTKLNDMNVHRGDQAVVALQNYLFVIGGEYKTKCTGDAAEFTTPADEVDVLDVSVPSSWRKLDDIPDNRFRFTGEAHAASDTIYIFGGQKYYDVDCDCYDVSDKVLAYHVHYDDFAEKMGVMGSASSAFGIRFGFGAFIGTVFVLFMTLI